MTDILGQTPTITHLLRTLPMIALSEASVLISGETGTGKELVAHALHQQSRRGDQSLVVINCAALPEAAVEADLFGAVNGETVTTTGRLLAADGSSVFLDEVDALPLHIQAKILRFIEAGECQITGSHRLQRADVRVIAATSTDLSQAVEAGTFRADLYYRLQVVPIELPPLRQRRDDIALLLKYYAKHLAGQNAPLRFARETLQTLEDYAWPGNVRELVNFVQRFSVLHAGALIQPDQLPAEMISLKATATTHFRLPPQGVDLASVELDLIEQALAQTAGNRSRAARLLGVSRDTLLYRMQKHGLTD